MVGDEMSSDFLKSKSVGVAIRELIGLNLSVLKGAAFQFWRYLLVETL